MRPARPTAFCGTSSRKGPPQRRRQDRPRRSVRAPYRLADKPPARPHFDLAQAHAVIAQDDLGRSRPGVGPGRRNGSPPSPPAYWRAAGVVGGHTLELRRGRGAIGAWAVPRLRSPVSPAPPLEADRLGANVGAAAAAQAGEGGGTGRRPRSLLK